MHTGRPFVQRGLLERNFSSSAAYFGTLVPRTKNSTHELSTARFGTRVLVEDIHLGPSYDTDTHVCKSGALRKNASKGFDRQRYGTSQTAAIYIMPNGQ